MRAYILKRLLLIPITLIGITFVTFLLIQLVPGDPARVARAQASGQNVQATQANVEAIELWKKERHLDKPVVVQYLIWLRDLAMFDLGRSLGTGRQSVWSLIAERLPVTLLINVIALIFTYVIAVPVGVVCGAKQFTVTDRALTVVVFLLYSLPSFWVGTMLIAFATGKMFPTTGYFSETDVATGFTWFKEWARHLTLPLICATYPTFAFLSRQMRSSLLEQIRQDFVRTARAKGLSERVVILRHATRNALIPIITLLGTLLPAMIGGSIIIEQLFSIPGMGQLFFLAVNERDYTVIMGIEVISALMTLFGMLLSDILYVLVNPTIAYD